MRSAAGTTATREHAFIAAQTQDVRAIRNLHGLFTVTGDGDSSYLNGYIAFVKLNETESGLYSSAEIEAIAADSTERSRLFCIHPIACHGKNMLVVPISCRSIQVATGETVKFLVHYGDVSGQFSWELATSMRVRSRDVT